MRLDPGYAEIIVKKLGLESSHAMSSPIVKVAWAKGVSDASGMLDSMQATRFKHVVAQADHLVPDRPDIKIVCPEPRSSMSCPRAVIVRSSRDKGETTEAGPRFVHGY